MKILVWGTGRLTGKVVGRWISLDDVIAFVDNNTSIENHMGKPVISPQDIEGCSYDAIVIANLFSKDIIKQCEKMGGWIPQKLSVYITIARCWTTIRTMILCRKYWGMSTLKL